uniref:Uncharacterized protein n=1 Tax=Physcomitrium patens TaxID=3218 RepID=A0A7I4EXZ7_PHYPA
MRVRDYWSRERELANREMWGISVSQNKCCLFRNFALRWHAVCTPCCGDCNFYCLILGAGLNM